MNTPQEFRKWICARLKGNCNHKAVDATPSDHYRAVAKSPLYRLPTELRLRILRLAFGDKTLHLDLDRPMAREDPYHSKDDYSLFFWCGFVCEEPKMGTTPATDRCDLWHPGVEKIGIWGYLNSCHLG